MADLRFNNDQFCQNVVKMLDDGVKAIREAQGQEGQDEHQVKALASKLARLNVSQIKSISGCTKRGPRVHF
jgi:hypothetical protein